MRTVRPARWLPLAFALLLCFAAYRHLTAAGWTLSGGWYSSIATLRAENPPADPGTLPAEWPAGLQCGAERPLFVHQYNDDLYIIRQSKCVTFEAPFLYLLFGEDKALLMDTGAVADSSVVRLVDRLVQQWLAANGKAEIPLIVAHTHSHGDHTAADGYFRAAMRKGLLPYIETVVDTSVADVIEFWGFEDFPNDVPTIDLGDRVIDVLGTPGHQAASVTLYDRNTQLLLTGDLVYAGHLFIFTPAHVQDFNDSLQRLVDWAVAHPVEWVLGCHIEFSDTPFEPFAWGTPKHPDEHELEFPPEKLADIALASQGLGGNPDCTIFDEFVIHPVYKCGITWNGD